MIYPYDVKRNAFNEVMGSFYECFYEDNLNAPDFLGENYPESEQPPELLSINNKTEEKLC